MPLYINLQRKVEKKRKSKQLPEVPHKKVKLSNGFIVENCKSTTPSMSSDMITEDNSKNGNKIENKSKNKNLKKKIKLGDSVENEQLNLNVMTSWLQYEIPEPILKGIAEQGFKVPTKIQELTLPPAMFGKSN